MKTVQTVAISWASCVLMGVGTIILLNMCGISIGVLGALLLGGIAGATGIMVGSAVGA